MVYFLNITQNPQGKIPYTTKILNSICFQVFSSLGMLYLPFYHFLIQHFLFLYNKCLYNALGLIFLMVLYSKKCSFPRMVHNKLVTLNNLSMSNMHGFFCHVQTRSLNKLYLTITQTIMGDAYNCHKFKRGLTSQTFIV